MAVENQTGQVLGPYQIIKEIGRGGMAVVYQPTATDPAGGPIPYQSGTIREQGPTSTLAPQPTVTPRPTSMPSPPAYPAPVLLEPGDGTRITDNDTVVLRWRWDGSLGPNEYYDVRVWREGGDHWGVTWTSETFHSITNRASLAPPLLDPSFVPWYDP